MHDDNVGIGPEKILEYAAFFEIPVTLYLSENADLRLVISVRDVFKDKFSAVVLRHPPLTSGLVTLLNQNVRAIMRYKAKALNFVLVNIGDLNEISTETVLWFKMPQGLFFSERRKYNRIDLQISKTSLIGRAKFFNGKNEIDADVAKLLYVSPDDIAFMVPSDLGVIPGDAVLSFSLYERDILVMDASGIVLKTEKWLGDSENNIGVIVSLNKYQRKHIEQVSLTTDRRVADQRLNMTLRKGSFVEFSHPIFDSCKIFGEIDDISTSGISFVLKKSRFPILTGMFFHDFQIQLPETRRHFAKLKVLNIESRSSYSGHILRVGGEFFEMETELLKDIAITISKASVPNLTEATMEDQEDLLEFFFETGFIYRGKQQQMKGNSRKIFNTFVNLLAANNPIAKVVLYKEAGEIKGHISTVRFFDSSWLIQHLSAKATANSVLAGRAMIDSMTTFFRNAKANDLLKSKYILFYFRPNNIYPAAVFNGVKEIINDRAICDSYDLRFCLLNKSSKTLPRSRMSDSGVFREANEKDLTDLESLLKKQGHDQIVDAEDLAGDAFNVMKIAAEYQKLNLYRYRRIFVANDTRNKIRIFAVCNYASPGINLSELTNSYRMFSDSEINQSYADLLDFFVEYILDTYKTTDVGAPVLLLERDHPIPSQYHDEKIYTYWRLNIKHVDKFKRATEIVFTNMKRFIKHQKELSDNSSMPTFRSLAMGDFTLP